MKATTLTVVLLVCWFVSGIAWSQDLKAVQIGIDGGSFQDSELLIERLDTGRLGVNNTAPNHLLDIYGVSNSAAELALSNLSTAVTSGTTLGSLLFRSNDSSTGAAGVVVGLSAIASGDHTSTYHRTDLVFKTSNGVAEYGAERMRLHYDGSLSIGTSTHSSYMLYVDGIFSVDGFRTESGNNVVGGYVGNTISSGSRSVIGGGGALNYVNSISGDYSVLGGGYDNEIVGSYSMIGGGYSNDVDSTYSLVSGGRSNSIGTTSSYSSILGGYGNSIGNYLQLSVILGGQNNQINRTTGTLYGNLIGGGYDNEIVNGSYNLIVGGLTNYTQTGDYNVIAGGSNNTTNSSYNVVPGGYNNDAIGGYSFAAGHSAIASYAGSFVWSNWDSGSGTCTSSTWDQFKVCAVGGAWFSHNVSAQSFTDRTPYPVDLATAYVSVLSMRRLPDGEYDPSDEAKQLDHDSLAPFVAVVEADGTKGRNLSATVSAQNEVIKSLIERVTALELEVVALKAGAR